MQDKSRENENNWKRNCKVSMCYTIWWRWRRELSRTQDLEENFPILEEAKHAEREQVDETAKMTHWPTKVFMAFWTLKARWAHSKWTCAWVHISSTIPTEYINVVKYELQVVGVPSCCSRERHSCSPFCMFRPNSWTESNVHFFWTRKTLCHRTLQPVKENGRCGEQESHFSKQAMTTL